MSSNVYNTEFKNNFYGEISRLFFPWVSFKNVYRSSDSYFPEQ